MSVKYLFAMLALGVASCVASELVSPKSSAANTNTGLGIYDGKKTTIQKHPYVASLLLDGSLWCAGTVVSSNWIITIAECVYSLSTSDLSVVVGSNDGLNGKKYTVKSFTTHPKYSYGYFDYDFACVQISGKFKWSSKTKPIKIGTKEPKANAKFTVAGYGDTSDVGAPANNDLLQGTLMWESKSQCKTFLESIGITWTPRLACGYNKGKTTLCQGDWADALVYKNAVYGIFAVGAASGFCTSDAQPSGLADVTSVASWIKKVTGAKYDYE
ncbi:trypsin epsilon-like [Homalodisca vitripennis]|uniref:trypsin epsilon-like n=1 Tax=Homalodisca vitripennis TaxID=197043 RepID=UPI001EEB6654|nr:trypsin epsilon-like [Homalodisca vitripennis]